ncbi:hypothetical protein T06_16103 [Trichinella sp. T6]|nr:hypothetical protein T06_16103 [Trichinella sp. T6]
MTDSSAARHFAHFEAQLIINVWKSVDEEIDMLRVLDHFFCISRFQDNVSNYFENLYKPSQFLADTEKHLTTCGRSGFHQYIPWKPDKYDKKNILTL